LISLQPVSAAVFFGGCEKPLRPAGGEAGRYRARLRRVPSKSQYAARRAWATVRQGRRHDFPGCTGSTESSTLKTLAKSGEPATGKNPDAICYEPKTKRVFALNHSGNDATSIDELLALLIDKDQSWSALICLVRGICWSVIRSNGREGKPA
jgi:hypothetical protein